MNKFEFPEEFMGVVVTLQEAARTISGVSRDLMLKLGEAIEQSDDFDPEEWYAEVGDMLAFFNIAQGEFGNTMEEIAHSLRRLSE